MSEATKNLRARLSEPRVNDEWLDHIAIANDIDALASRVAAIEERIGPIMLDAVVDALDRHNKSMLLDGHVTTDKPAQDRGGLITALPAAPTSPAPRAFQVGDVVRTPLGVEGEIVADKDAEGLLLVQFHPFGRTSYHPSFLTLVRPAPAPAEDDAALVAWLQRALDAQTGYSVAAARRAEKAEAELLDARRARDEATKQIDSAREFIDANHLYVVGGGHYSLREVIKSGWEQIKYERTRAEKAEAEVAVLRGKLAEAHRLAGEDARKLAEAAKRTRTVTVRRVTKKDVKAWNVEFAQDEYDIGYSGQARSMNAVGLRVKVSK